MGGFAFPQNNPTGTVGAGNFNGAAMFNPGSGFGAPASAPGTGTGGPGNMNFGNSTNPMPQTSGTSGGSSAPTHGTSSTGASDPFSGYVTSEGSTTASANPYGISQSQANWMENYLQKTYGGGMGALVYQYLMSNGGYNSQLTGQAVGATTNAMQGQIQSGANNLTSSLSSMGVTGGSSSMGDALSTYQNQAVSSENAVTSNMYMNMWSQAQSNELNALEFAATGTGKTLANKPNWMDYVSEGAGIIGSVAGAVL